MAATRTLPTTVWLPAGPGPNPLVVFAHGFRLGVGPYRRACQAWAEAGFVVAAPSFPLTDLDVAGSNLDEADIVNQPADVSFVIDHLVAATADPSTAVSGSIDASRIAVVGHSDGAETALAVGYLPGSLDRRVLAVVADAANPFRGVPLSRPLTSTVPLLLIHGDADKIVPFSRSEQVGRQIRTPGWLLRLNSADHLSPIEGPSVWTSTFDAVTRDFLTAVFSRTDPGPALTADAAASDGSATLAAL